MNAVRDAEVRCVAIVGLGLIGGSVARDLAARGVRVLAHDRDTTTMDAAVSAGVVQGGLNESPEGEVVDAVLLAVPVTAAAAALSRFAGVCRSARLVTDVGSTKVGIQDAAERAGLEANFVGSHPLTGGHQSGWSASRTGLFDGARVYLCAAHGASPGAIDVAERLWTSLGARPEHVDARWHDHRLAWSSHLPQFTSYALAAVLREAGVARVDLGPGGRDATRLAGSSTEVWTAVAAENAPLLAAALCAVEARLGAMRGALERRDMVSIGTQLAMAREWFDASGSGAAGRREDASDPLR